MSPNLHGTRPRVFCSVVSGKLGGGGCGFCGVWKTFDVKTPKEKGTTTKNKPVDR